LAKRLLFTELSLSRLRPVAGQTQYWDTKQTGLSLLVSAGRGTKTYRSTYALHGKYISRKIGRFGEVSLEDARRITREDRGHATLGKDPKAAKKKALILYGEVVDEFIEHYAKPRQRTWDQTERVLKGKVTCEAWLKRPMASITKQEVRALLRGFVADGHPYKAAQTQTWLKSLWRWALRQDLVETNIMEAVEIDIEKRSRERIYSDAELIAIWKAAEKLFPIEGAYIKLMLLLAPRKTALALMKRSDLNNPDYPLLWTTPFELTKSKKTLGKKRVYQTPLPLLAQRIIKGLPKSSGDRLFPSLSHQPHESRTTFIYERPADRACCSSRRPCAFRVSCRAPYHRNVPRERRQFGLGARAGAQSQRWRRDRGILARLCARPETDVADEVVGSH
jgi:hypothetical protein